ncbi:unnamed protein product [Colias eurytheme]|nr:unnamed protein product [Colias eurytheme]
MRQEMKHRPRRGEKYDPNLTIVIENKKVSYKCNTCSKEFQKRGHYTQHRNYVHLKKRPKVFGCNLCDVRVPHNKRAMHMETHGLKAPTCGACGKKFSFPFLVERHIRIYHMFEKDHKCPECGLEFATQNKLQQHSLTHTDKRPYPCEICGKSYRSRTNLRRHMKMHLNIRNHVCPVCEEAFVQQTSLKYHMKSRHSDYSGPLQRKQDSDDGAQRKETAPSVQTMRQEMKHRPRRGEKYDPNLTIVIENKKVSYKCNTCSKEFQKRAHYTQHRNYVHLKKRPKVFGCNLCDVRVPQNKRAMHMETHGLKAPTCGACGKKFSYPFQVERHIRIYHMFEKDHKCPECGLEFATQNKLQQHSLTHTDKRPYPCEICGKSYRSRSNLRTHVKMHLNIRNYACPVCEEAFVQKTSLKYHMKSRHSDYSGPLKRKQDSWRTVKVLRKEEDGIIVWQCVDCGRNFKKRDHFSQHYKFVHLKMRPKLRSCHLCNEKVPTQNRPFHMEIAHGLPAPSCGACGKKFAFPNQVLRHQKAYHMGEKRFTCTICDMKFASNSLLMTHTIKHTALRPYKCSYCEKSFRWKKNLKTHVHMHLDVRNHVCRICGESFVQQSSLKYHMTKRHLEAM